MRGIPASLLLVPALAVMPAATAAAAVHVRATVAADTLAQCSSAHFSAALWNSGADTLRVRVLVSLVARDSFPLGTLIGTTTLLPGEVRTREFDVPMPARLAPGPYTLDLRAIAPDATEDRSAVRFAVGAADCPLAAGAGTGDPGLDLMSAVSRGLSLEPDAATPTLHNSWGQLKARYRR
jgi:hypothetical protein